MKEEISLIGEIIRTPINILKLILIYIVNNIFSSIIILLIVFLTIVFFKHKLYKKIKLSIGNKDKKIKCR